MWWFETGFTRLWYLLSYGKKCMRTTTVGTSPQQLILMKRRRQRKWLSNQTTLNLGRMGNRMILKMDLQLSCPRCNSIMKTEQEQFQFEYSSSIVKTSLTLLLTRAAQLAITMDKRHVFFTWDHNIKLMLPFEWNWKSKWKRLTLNITVITYRILVHS